LETTLCCLGFAAGLHYEGVTKNCAKFKKLARGATKMILIMNKLITTKNIKIAVRDRHQY